MIEESQQKSAERVCIYIDGSNFFKYLKNDEIAFPKGEKFDYSRFVEYLLKGRTLTPKRYYVGIARDFDGSEKSKTIVRGQQKFLAKIQNEGFDIKRGSIAYDAGNIREKGTDVRLAIDLVIGAVDGLYDTAVLVSSGTDLIPAIRYVKYRGKRLDYIGFSHSPSLGIQKHADYTKLLSKEDIDNFKTKTLLDPENSK